MPIEVKYGASPGSLAIAGFGTGMAQYRQRTGVQLANLAVEQQRLKQQADLAHAQLDQHALEQQDLADFRTAQVKQQALAESDRDTRSREWMATQQGQQMLSGTERDVGSRVKEASGLNLTPEGKQLYGDLTGKLRAIQRSRSELRPEQYAQALAKWQQEYDSAGIANHVAKIPTMEEDVQSNVFFHEPTQKWLKRTTRNGKPAIDLLYDDKPAAKPDKSTFYKDYAIVSKSLAEQDQASALAAGKTDVPPAPSPERIVAKMRELQTMKAQFEGQGDTVSHADGDQPAPAQSPAVLSAADTLRKARDAETARGTLTEPEIAAVRAATGVLRKAGVDPLSVFQQPAVGSPVQTPGSAAAWSPSDQDLRSDGTRKGMGYLGALQRPDGGVSTELSIGVDFDGKQMEIPSLVPTLTKKEVDYLLAGGKMTDAIVGKAVAHAKKRLADGRSVWADESDRTKEVKTKGLPAGVKVEEITQPESLQSSIHSSILAAEVPWYTPPAQKPVKVKRVTVPKDLDPADFKSLTEQFESGTEFQFPNGKIVRKP